MMTVCDLKKTFARKEKKKAKSTFVNIPIFDKSKRISVLLSIKLYPTLMILPALPAEAQRVIIVIAQKMTHLIWFCNLKKIETKRFIIGYKRGENSSTLCTP